MRRGFAVSRAMRRLFAGQSQVFDSLIGITALPIMARDVAQMIVDLIGELRLHYLRDTLMQRFAALSQYAVVGHLLRKRVLEGVFDIGKSGLLVDEFSLLQLGQHRFQNLFRGTGYRPDQFQPELLADY